MRRILLGFALLLWFSRITDPVLHSLAHDHHEHCSERGLHLHEGDDSCQWTDPAYLVGLQPVAIGWELMPHTLGRNESVARVASAKNADSEAVALRGPPVG
jgi:hypothetical protein